MFLLFFFLRYSSGCCVENTVKQRNEEVICMLEKYNRHPGGDEEGQLDVESGVQGSSPLTFPALLFLHSW